MYIAWIHVLSYESIGSLKHLKPPLTTTPSKKNKKKNNKKNKKKNNNSKPFYFFIFSHQDTYFIIFFIQNYFIYYLKWNGGIKAQYNKHPHSLIWVFAADKRKWNMGRSVYLFIFFVCFLFVFSQKEKKT